MSDVGGAEPSGKRVILLNGPDHRPSSAYYGGGTGGMTRNIQIYLREFQSPRFVYRYCPNTARATPRPSLFNHAKRLLVDGLRFWGMSRGVSAAHIFGQYRQAVIREWLFVSIARVRRIPVLYQIRAGTFLTWFESCGPIRRAMMTRILRSARVILCEGRPYVNHLAARLGIESHHFPNFMPSSEIPDRVDPKPADDALRVLFVGYCHAPKGVFELVEGCHLASREHGLKIDLTLVGAEETRFSTWCDGLRIDEGTSFCLRRRGRLPHRETLLEYRNHDIFFLPSSHPSEGHNNSVNEAMAMGLVVVASRHGFLEDVLADTGIFLEEVRPAEIARALMRIDRNRGRAREQACAARRRLLDNFNSDKAFPTLENHYETLVGCRANSEASDKKEK